MDHTELVNLARKWLTTSRKCAVVVSEICAQGNEQPDALGWYGLVTTMVECKTSRADFLTDKKKHFRRYLDSGVGDFRYYLTAKNVSIIKDVSELPDGFGWLEATEIGKVKIKVKALAQPKKSTRGETGILLSLLRRVAHDSPKNVSVKCYAYQTNNRTVLEINNGEREGWFTQAERVGR